MNRKQSINITNQEYWVKVVGMLQQNWAIIERASSGDKVTVYFIDDASGIFDEIHFPLFNVAIAELLTNGFSKFQIDAKHQSFLTPPRPPFLESAHPNGKIYSSGKYWNSEPKMMGNFRDSAKKRHRATVIVQMTEGILLAETNGGLALLPGGGIGRSEAPIAAGARELFEETNLLAHSISFLFNHESHSTIHHVFLAQANGNPKPGDDAVRLSYFSDNACSSGSAMTPATLLILERYFQHI